MTCSAKLDFYLMILRCHIVLHGLPVCQMLRLAFDFVLGSFFGRKNAHFTVSHYISIVVLKLRLYLGFLDIAYRLGVTVATGSHKFHKILNLITAKIE